MSECQEPAISVPTAAEAALSESRKRSAEVLEHNIHKRVAVAESSGTTMGALQGAVLAPTSMLKILCPNNMVGAMIGKGGVILKELKELSGTDIKLSQDEEFFPETSDRIIAISGPAENVRRGIELVLSKMFEISDSSPTRSQLLLAAPMLTSTDGSGSAVPTTPRRHLVRGLVPVSASGLIIGHGGSVIRELSESTGTKVQLAENRDPYQTKERIMNVYTPTSTAAIQVFLAVFQKLTSDPAGSYTNTGIKYSNAGAMPSRGGGGPGYPNPMPAYSVGYGLQPPPQVMYGAPPVGQYGGGRAPAGAISAASSSAGVGMTPQLPVVPTATKSIGVADNLVGAVVGRGGSVIKDIMMQSGTKINVSQKGDLIPGTNDRKITITGQQHLVDYAELLIMNQLSRSPGSGAGRVGAPQGQQFSQYAAQHTQSYGQQPQSYGQQPQSYSQKQSYGQQPQPNGQQQYYR